MSSLKRIVLDVLKPHQPSGLEFTRTLAELGSGYQVKYKVDEIDEKTESVIVCISGANIDFDLIQETITNMGASLHSVDEIEISNES